MPKHYRPPGKKKEGNAAKYVTRSQAIKQLQVSLGDFRRLCIYKGVFPREPKKKFRGNHQTYYHTKDILFIRHDPIVDKLREIKAYEKKVKKAFSKKNKELAFRLLSRKPNYTLDRLIHERYPRFIDALGDLDDCLSMVHLFAALPASETEKVGVQRIHNCRRLCHEWQAYISRSHKLRKTFISVKGIYYEVEIEGQKIRWITPHRLQQVVPDDVDFGIMLIFLEFYETLLAFINFKLYHSIGMKYPPILDPRLEALADELYALSRSIAAKSGLTQLGNGSATPQSDESELRLAQLQHQLPSHGAGSLKHLVEDDEEPVDDETKECKSLFKNMKFYLSREVPREALLFIIPAFGGDVSWEGDGAPYNESDGSITYQIVDRPTQGHKFLSREYVQPQWVFDCVNARIILPTEEYVVGRICPPHLSPFVDNEAEGYIPDYAEKIKQLKSAAKNVILPMPGVEGEDINDPQNLLAEGVFNRAVANEAANKTKKTQELEKQHQEELKKELQGIQYVPSSASEEEPAKDAEGGAKDGGEEDDYDNNLAKEDAARMEKLSLSRKQRGMVEAIEISRKRKQASVEKLKDRKRRIQKNKGSKE